MVLISMPPFGAQHFIKLLVKNKTYLLDKLEFVNTYYHKDIYLKFSFCVSKYFVTFSS